MITTASFLFIQLEKKKPVIKLTRSPLKIKNDFQRMTSFTVFFYNKKVSKDFTYLIIKKIFYLFRYVSFTLRWTSAYLSPNFCLRSAPLPYSPRITSFANWSISPATVVVGDCVGCVGGLTPVGVVSCGAGLSFPALGLSGSFVSGSVVSPVAISSVEGAPSVSCVLTGCSVRGSV